MQRIGWAHCCSLKTAEVNGIRIEKNEAELLEKTKQTNRGSNVDKRRVLSFTRLFLPEHIQKWHWTTLGRAFCSPGKRLLSTGTTEGYSWSVSPWFLKAFKGLVSSWYSTLWIPHGCEREGTSLKKVLDSWRSPQTTLWRQWHKQIFWPHPWEPAERTANPSVSWRTKEVLLCENRRPRIPRTSQPIVWLEPHQMPKSYS